MKILPIRDLKNTVEIEKQCSSNEPVFITKNGYGKLVIMSMDYFEELFSELYEAKVISQGLEDYKNGKTVEGKKALDNIKKKHGL